MPGRCSLRDADDDTHVTSERKASAMSHQQPRQISVTLFTLLVLGVLMRATFLLWHPPFDTDFYDYETMAGLRESWFVMHFFVGAPGVVIAFVTFGMLAVTLASTGRVAQTLALAGTLVASAGALLFGFGLAAEGVVWQWTTDPAVIDPASGAALLRGIEAAPLTTPLIMLGSAVLIPLGVLLLLVAMLIARTVPRWLLIATFAILIIGAVVPPVPMVAAVSVALQSIALIAIGFFAVRTPK